MDLNFLLNAPNGSNGNLDTASIPRNESDDTAITMNDLLQVLPFPDMTTEQENTSLSGLDELPTRGAIASNTLFDNDSTLAGSSFDLAPLPLPSENDISTAPLPVVTSQLYTIEPPPQSTYESEEAVIAALHRWTKEHGFNVTKRRAFPPNAAPNEVWKRGFDCDRAGKPKCTQHLTDDNRQRPMRGSMRIGCPMKIIVRAVCKDHPKGPWKIVHTRNGSSLHNHPPSQDARVHPGHRQRACAATDVPPAASLELLVQAQTRVGIAPGAVCASLFQADPGSFVIPQDIANMRNATRRRELATQTVVEVLFSRLNDEGFYYRWETDPESNQLLYLFWAHPRTLSQYRRHPEVLGMDCTYKTNKYKLPLLNIISLTGFNTVLPVAQCWLPREREEDYEWAMRTLRDFLIEMRIGLPCLILTDRELASMNAIDAVFPEVAAVVCRWHMNKNVLNKTRQILGQVPVENPAPGQPKYENTWQTDAFMSAFYEAVDAATEEEFEDKHSILRSLNRPLSDYLDKHWWKYKTRIVRAWTDRFQHFGIRDTSFVEGAHAKCKVWLRGCNGDILTVFLSLLPWWQAAASNTSLLAERNSARVPYLLQGNRFAAVTRIITVWALTRTNELWEEARMVIFRRADQGKCTGVFRTVHGRPCLHELIALTESNGRQILSPHDFALHWWINRDLAHTLPIRIQEPAYTQQAQLQRRRRVDRHSRVRRSNATRRDPALFERIDLNHPATPPSARLARQASSDTVVTWLPPLTGPSNFTATETNIYHENDIPPRFWGHARWG